MTSVTEKQLPATLQDEESVKATRLTLASPPREVRKDNYSKTEYVPISEIEAALDDVFGAVNWKTENYQIISLGASTQKQGQIYIAATITLSVINQHFDTPVWVSREGAASGYCSHGVITTFAAKLKAEAFKNAAKSLGKVFGRDLNRKHQETRTQEMHDETYVQAVKEAGDMETLAEIWKDTPLSIQKTEWMRAAYKAQTNLLKQQSK